MLRNTFIFLRRGKPNPPRGLKEPRVPDAHRPFQGGQQHFQQLLLHRANQQAAREQFRVNKNAASAAARGGGASSSSSSAQQQQASSSDPLVKFPEQDLVFSRNKRFFGNNSSPVEDPLNSATEQFTHRRSFNDRDFYDRIQIENMRARHKQLQQEQQQQQEKLDGSNSDGAAGESNNQHTTEIVSGLPKTIVGDEEFEAAHGFSLLKKKLGSGRHGNTRSSIFPPAGTTSSSSSSSSFSYSNLDLWGEQPTYSASTYFLYLVSRRRNQYAVIFDHEGNRVMPVYTVGNRGLKESDRGFKAEGSAENAHQVVSQYLSDVLPKIREIEHNAGRTDRKKKIELVVRVLGFYNGRQGAIRAVTDHSDAFEVKYLEDVTPFPLNGPRMPRAIVKQRN